MNVAQTKSIQTAISGGGYKVPKSTRYLPPVARSHNVSMLGNSGHTQ